MTERRTYPREKAPYLAVLTHEDLGKVVGRIVNMSNGGIFLEVDSKLGFYQSQLLKAKIIGEGWDPSMPSLAMRVVRLEDKGIVLQFDEPLGKSNPLEKCS